MHKSCLAGFIIDCNTQSLEQAAEFWSKALGYTTRPPDADGKYITFDTGKTGLHIEVQKVSHPSRVHLDIQADDVDAEALRLEKLGAKRIEKIRTWWVMEAPTGQRFCVVKPQQADFSQRANLWDNDASK